MQAELLRKIKAAGGIVLPARNNIDLPYALTGKEIDTLISALEKMILDQK